MKHLSLVFVLFLTLFNGLSQTVFYLENEDIYIDSLGLLFIEGDFHTGLNSMAINKGEINLENNWVNNSGSTSLETTVKGLVTMSGQDQQFDGSNNSEFYNLTLENNSQKLQNTNITINGNLSLTNANLETSNNRSFLTNTNTNALSWNNGFISSSSIEGAFYRSTSSNNSYYFPVGASSTQDIYRAVKITPLSSDSNVYGVRFAPVNPDVEFGVSNAGAIAPFDRTLKENEIENINEFYYHNLYHSFGNAKASVEVFFFDYDGEFSTMAEWKDNTQWRDAKFDVANTISETSIGNPTHVARANSYDDFNLDPFALAKTKEKIDYSLGVFVSNNGDGKNDYFVVNGIENYPNNELKIFNRWGNVVYSTVNYKNNWDGFSNQPNFVNTKENHLPSGTYFFILKLDENTTETGYIQLQK